MCTKKNCHLATFKNNIEIPCRAYYKFFYTTLADPSSHPPVFCRPSYSMYVSSRHTVWLSWLSLTLVKTDAFPPYRP